MASPEQIAFRDSLVELGGIAVAGHYVLTPQKDGWRYLLTLDGAQVGEFAGNVDLFALSQFAARAISAYRADKKAMRRELEQA